MSRETISLNLRMFRNEKGLTQERLAEEAGISRIAYRKIETGESVPRVDTLQNIARALGVKLQDLVRPVSSLRAVRFRARKKMLKRDSILIDVARWLDDFNFLEGVLGKHIEYKFAELAKTISEMEGGKDRAVQAAHQARKALDLKEKEPVRDICGLLQSAGIKVYPVKLASSDFFGLSVAPAEGGPAIIVNVWDRISVERWIFSAAHEMGHLLLHLSSYNVALAQENETEEAEADAFASYFLMPDEGFRGEWNETYGLPFLQRIWKVKRIFRVSYLTVLYRLSQSEYMGSGVWAKFSAFYKRYFGRTLTRAEEPQALDPDSFHAAPAVALRSQEPDNLIDADFVEDRLSSLVRQAIEAEQITLERGADVLRLDLMAMRERAAAWVR